MKCFWFGSVMSLLLALSLMTVQAIGVVQGPASMSRHFTADTQLFFSIRTDDGYIEALDGVLSKVTRTLGENGLPVPPVSLAALLAANDFGNGITYADIRAWLGDYAALGLGNLGLAINDPNNAFNNGEAPFSLVVAIKDKAAAVAFFERLIPPDNLKKSELGDYTIFADSTGDTSFILAVGSEVMVITNRRDELPGVSRVATLDSREDFQEALRRLPAPSYNILAYADGNAFLDATLDQLPPDQLSLLEAQGNGRGTLGSIAFGAIILEGRTLAIDFVQQSRVIVDASFAPLSADFLSLLPSSVDALFAANNLSASIETGLASVDLAAQQLGDPGVRRQLEGALSALGIDLEQDVLSWTTGGYALLFGLEFAPLLDLIDDPSQFEALFRRLPVDFGLLLEVTDSAKAQVLARKLSQLISSAVSSDPSLSRQVRVDQTTIGTAAATIISIDLPLSQNSSAVLNFVIATDDRAFFIGLQSTAEDIFLGSGKLVDTPAYQDAARFFIPNTAQLLYTNDEGLTETIMIPTVVGLLFLGPSIGEIFDDLQRGLRSSNDDLAQMVQGVQDTALIAQGLRAFNAVVASSSLSSALVDEGWVITRLALTLEP